MIDKETLRRLIAIAALIAAVASFVVGMPATAVAIILLAILALL